MYHDFNPRWFWPKVSWASSKSLEGKCKICVQSTINVYYVESLKVPTLDKNCFRPLGVSRFWLKVSYGETFDVIYLHIDWFWSEGVSWFLTKVIWTISMSVEGKVQSSCPFDIFQMENIERYWLTVRLFITWGCIAIFTKGHLSKFYENVVL